MVKEVCKYMEVSGDRVVCGYNGRADGRRMIPLQQNIEVLPGTYQAVRGCTAKTPAQQTKCLLHLVRFDPQA